MAPSERKRLSVRLLWRDPVISWTPLITPVVNLDHKSRLSVCQE